MRELGRRAKGGESHKFVIASPVSLSGCGNLDHRDRFTRVTVRDDRHAKCDWIPDNHDFIVIEKTRNDEEETALRPYFITVSGVFSLAPTPCFRVRSLSRQRRDVPVSPRQIGRITTLPCP